MPFFFSIPEQVVKIIQFFWAVMLSASRSMWAKASALILRLALSMTPAHMVIVIEYV
jgi:hypothetical protein